MLGKILDVIITVTGIVGSLLRRSPKDTEPMPNVTRLKDDIEIWKAQKSRKDLN